jgi:hypothetical protein
LRASKEQLAVGGEVACERLRGKRALGRIAIVKPDLADNVRRALSGVQDLTTPSLNPRTPGMLRTISTCGPEQTRPG